MSQADVITAICLLAIAAVAFIYSCRAPRISGTALGRLRDARCAVTRPSRWRHALPRWAIRVSVMVLMMVVSAEWSQAVVTRRDRIIDRTLYIPVPSMCENARGYWRQCPWVGPGRFVSEDDAIAWRLDSRCSAP